MRLLFNFSIVAHIYEILVILGHNFQAIPCLNLLVAGNLPGESDTHKWMCTCDSANQRNQTYAVAANCSASCDCNPGTVANLYDIIICNFWTFSLFVFLVAKLSGKCVFL